MHIESGRSLLKLTSATYWRPSEKNIHRMPADDESAEWGVTPDEGFAVPLTYDEYDVWRNYRGRRDLIGEGVEGEWAKELTQQDGEIPADYHDAALQRAIEFLSQKPENSDK